MQVNINELTQTIVDTKELQELKRIAKKEWQECLMQLKHSANTFKVYQS